MIERERKEREGEGSGISLTGRGRVRVIRRVRERGTLVPYTDAEVSCIEWIEPGDVWTGKQGQVLVKSIGWSGKMMNSKMAVGQAMEMLISSGEVWDSLLKFKQISYQASFIEEIEVELYKALLEMVNGTVSKPYTKKEYLSGARASILVIFFNSTFQAVQCASRRLLIDGITGGVTA
ncbi:hypothetical protein BDN67DRAFT_985807 [Paxillus ammoniavirescens]|nr:hypothetical protein BDN67DRAFT_985807 [Paxillus ammoniavirescens]